jgi:DNA-3-methyladenine glycosylase
MRPVKPFPSGFFLRPTLAVAPRLLGCKVSTCIDGQLTSGIISEVEAYLPDDSASHSFRGRTKRNNAMFLAGGHAYVYFIYGNHYCFNVVTEAADIGAAVLIRALQPLEGIETMRLRRFGDASLTAKDTLLTNGPGKLCKALGIDLRHSGTPLNQPGQIFVQPFSPVAKATIFATPRIGISTAQERLWRFCVR